MSLLLNVLWIVSGGLWMAVGWCIAAVLMAITIVALPWTRAAFNIAAYTLLPFGQKAVSRAEYYGTDDLGTGPLGFLGNVVVGARRLVVGTRAYHHSNSSRRHYYRNSICVGTFEARRNSALAHRKDNCAA